jgi:serine/threonine protein kinase
VDKMKKKLKFQPKPDPEEDDESPINYTNTGSLVVNKKRKSGEKSFESVRISPKGFLGSEKINLSDYKLKKILGDESLNGGVELRENEKKDKIIVKTIKIDPIKANEILSELQVLKDCKHHQIVSLKNVLLEEKQIKIILEYMDCGLKIIFNSNFLKEV